MVLWTVIFSDTVRLLELSLWHFTFHSAASRQVHLCTSLCRRHIGYRKWSSVSSTSHHQLSQSVLYQRHGLPQLFPWNRDHTYSSRHSLDATEICHGSSGEGKYAECKTCSNAASYSSETHSELWHCSHWSSWISQTCRKPLVLALTRHDISYAVNKLSQFMHMPTTDHWQAAKRVLCYLSGTLTHGIFLRKQSKPILHAYSDADWAGESDDYVSTNTYIIYMGSNPVSWTSKKQKGVARCSTESEYRAVANTASMGLFITHGTRCTCSHCPHSLLWQFWSYILMC